RVRRTGAKDRTSGEARASCPQGGPQAPMTRRSVVLAALAAVGRGLLEVLDSLADPASDLGQTRRAEDQDDDEQDDDEFGNPQGPQQREHIDLLEVRMHEGILAPASGRLQGA